MSSPSRGRVKVWSRSGSRGPAGAHARAVTDAPKGRPRPSSANQRETGVITVEVWTTTLKSVAFHPSQRSVTTVRVSHTWWPSVPTRGRCPPPRLRTPSGPPPQLSPRKRRAGRARRPPRRKHLNGGVTPSAGGKAGTETIYLTPDPPFPCSYGISRWGCVYTPVFSLSNHNKLCD